MISRRALLAALLTAPLAVAGEARVLLVGDSIAYQLAPRLRKLLPLTADARGGSSARQWVQRGWFRRAVERYRPASVVVSLGVNCIRPERETLGRRRPGAAVPRARALGTARASATSSRSRRPRGRCAPPASSPSSSRCGDRATRRRDWPSTTTASTSRTSARGERGVGEARVRVSQPSIGSGTFIHWLTYPGLASRRWSLMFMPGSGTMTAQAS